jgi:hypothetical protein
VAGLPLGDVKNFSLVYQMGPLERANLNHLTTLSRFTTVISLRETTLIWREVARNYATKIMIEQAHGWNWDRTEGRNLCYTSSQQKRVHEPQSRENVDNIVQTYSAVS